MEFDPSGFVGAVGIYVFDTVDVWNVLNDGDDSASMRSIIS
jgi:hypothetical protein